MIGVVGFFTGDTVWIFGINSLHNVVHILSGIVLIWAGFEAGGKNAKAYNKIFGIVYLLVAILGFMSISSIVDLLALNPADNWLHLVIGIITTAMGLWA